MPLFDYRCSNCGHEFEALQAMSEAPLTVCPVCEAPQLKKVPAAPAFALKGGGWYKDLYGSAGSGKSSGSSGSGSSSSSTKSETKSESKSSSAKKD